MAEPITYLVAHLHDALADERLHEQAIEIVVVGERLELRGEVATPSVGRQRCNWSTASPRHRGDRRPACSRTQEPADEPEQL